MTADLSVSQLFQLYAPLAGLALFAFFLGGLATRVRTLERESKEGKEKREEDLAFARTERDEIVRMGTVLADVKTAVEKTGRELQGVHRQLANIATRSGNISRELLEDDR